MVVSVGKGTANWLFACCTFDIAWSNSFRRRELLKVNVLTCVKLPISMATTPGLSEAVMAIGKRAIAIDFFQTGRVCILNDADDHPAFVERPRLYVYRCMG